MHPSRRDSHPTRLSRIHYEWRLPTLVFTERGWAIEIETITDELLRGFDDRLANGPPYREGG